MRQKIPAIKRSQPKQPTGAPEGTTWYGGPIEWFSICLRITGDELVPEEITALMGCSPSEAEQKGMPVLRGDGSFMRMARSGGWRLKIKPEDTDERDCGEAMLDMLNQLPADPEMWEQLSARFSIDFFVGLSMTSGNKGLVLTPQVMSALATRGIEAGFDIYHEARLEEP